MDLKQYVANRIKDFRIKRGMNQEELALKLNTTKQAVSRYENGDRKANQDILFQLANILSVSVDDFFPSDKEKITLKSSDYPFLPTNVAAGLPENICGITNSDIEHISIPDAIMGKWAGQDDIYLMRINGQSMNNVIPDQSLIAVKPFDLNNLKNGDIVVFSDEHEYSVKRFYQHDDKLIFKPDSDDVRFTDYIVSTSNSDLKIHGKVVIYIVEQD